MLYNPLSSFTDLRNQLLNDSLRWFAIAAIPGFMISAIRALAIGWKPLMSAHFVLLLAIWLLWLARARLSYRVRVYGLLWIFWSISSMGLIQFGPFSLGGLFTLLLAFVAILFLDTQYAWRLIGINTLSLFLIGGAASMNWINFDINYPVYVHHPLIWIHTIWTLTAYATILALIGSRMIHALQERAAVAQTLIDNQRKIAANVPGVIYQFLRCPDGQFSFPYVSDGASRLFGLTPEMLAQDASAAFARVYSEDLAQMYTTIAYAAQTLTPTYESFRFIHHERGIIWLERFSTPERLPDGGTLWHGFICDISPLKVAEQRLSATLENVTNVAVQWYDSSGRILYWNHASTLMYGWDATEAVGKTLDQLIYTPEQAQAFCKILTRIANSGQTFGPADYQICHRDGSWRFITAIIFSIPGETGPIFASVDLDITERRTLERMKEDVDRIMRHDLKTPLHAIISIPEILELDATLSKEQRELMKLIKDSGLQMLYMINQSLDMFKIESGTYHYQPQFVDVLAVLARIEKQFYLQLVTKSIQFRITLHHSAPAETAQLLIGAEESLLYPLLSNLFINAIEASPNQAEILIALNADGFNTVLTIHNHGAVPQMIRERFFEKYSTHGKRTGTGLGTYSAWMLAKAMGYTLTMETSDTENTTTLMLRIPGMPRIS